MFLPSFIYVVEILGDIVIEFLLDLLSHFPNFFHDDRDVDLALGRQVVARDGAAKMGAPQAIRS